MKGMACHPGTVIAVLVDKSLYRGPVISQYYIYIYIYVYIYIHIYINFINQCVRASYRMVLYIKITF